MTITIELAHRNSQLLIIEVLARRIWKQYFEHFMCLDQVEYMLNRFQSCHAMTEQAKEGYKYYLIYMNQDPVGYFALRQRENRDIFFSKVYVLDAYICNDINDATLQFVKQKMHNINAETITVTVNKDNNQAMATYESLGFTRKGSVVTDIGNGYITDDWEYALVL